MRFEQPSDIMLMDGEIVWKDSDTPSRRLASLAPAETEDVLRVLAMPEEPIEGSSVERSQFMWIRLANGDLILGVFPQDGGYFAVEEAVDIAFRLRPGSADDLDP